MSILLVCGDGNSRYLDVLETLRRAGLAPAEPSKREGFDPVALSESACAANGIDPNDPSSVSQVELGKVWQALSVDLMLANLKQTDWGWADPRLVYMLEHWRDFDPQVRFVLVYSSPEQAVADLISKEEAAPERVERCLALWAAVNAELLRFHHANRDRCLLINAAAVAPDSRFFVGLVRDHLKAKLTAENVEPVVRTDRTPLFDLVATLLVEKADDARELFLELESSADIPGRHSVAATGGASGRLHNVLPQFDDPQDLEPRDLAMLVWEQYRTLRDTAAMREREVGELSAAHAALAAAKSSLEGELAGVTRERDAMVAIRVALDQKLAEVSTERDGIARDLARANAELRAARDTAARNAVDEEAAQAAEARVRKLTAENDLLEKRLAQLQEELEFHLRTSRSAAEAVVTETAVSVTAAEPGPVSPKAEAATVADGGPIIVDMRDAVDGEGWYHAEQEGRWSGPETVSRLHLPKLAPGTYAVEFDIVLTMSPAILRGMTVSLDGGPLKLRGDALGSPWWPPFARKKKPLNFPVVIATTAKITSGESATLEFRVPETISPSIGGSSDMRRLGVFLRRATLVKTKG